LLPELLADTKEHERIRLVTTLIPDAYSEEESFAPSQGALDRFQACYRQVLEALPAAEQRKVAERFATSVRHDSEQRIQYFGDIFFSAKDIAHLGTKDAGVVVKYLLTRLGDSGTGITYNFVRSLVGIGRFIAISGAADFADTLIRLSLRRNLNGVKVSDFVNQEYDNVPEEKAREKMTARISTWIEFGKDKAYPEDKLSRLEAISNAWLDIPF
jgi:hypothetical protein